ncbi:hypothetical protein QCA50_011077 [Cerrena zonata]|uniref:Ubiquitin carboxyl-terminal hydrolase n=1 Tax=Cerrena zonata TaxID=2478898 RepID=A0AAW0G043_9APHY
MSPSMPLPSPNMNGLGISGTNGYNGGLVSASSALNGYSSTSSMRGPVSIGLHSRVPAESNGASSSSSAFSPPFPEPVTVGRSRSGTDTTPHDNYARWIPSGSIDSPSSSPPLFRSTSEAKGTFPTSPPQIDMSKRPVSQKPMFRPSPNSIPYTSSIPEHTGTRHSPSFSYSTPISTVQYPQFPRTISPQVSGSSAFNTSSSGINGISPLPQASINPSPLSRRRSDYIDQSQEAISGIATRVPIDYPVIRPPPAAAANTLERQDNRPRLLQQQTGSKPMTSQNDYPITYWGDTQVGTSGLKNLGNTCYMNSTIQCLSATAPFATFFKDGTWQREVNVFNPMGTKGRLAEAFARILREMSTSEMQTLTPIPFRRSICQYASQFQGTEQHDSQEFLQFLLDGLHEDLNRVTQKPPMNMTPEREAELETLPTQIASEQEWQNYLTRNRSLVVDLFQGQFRNQLQCLTCRQTSTTYNSFMYLTLPIPTGRSSSEVKLSDCLDAFVKEEVMEKSDAWHCPKCKTLRQATKRLTLSRLPPILLVHLKRFSHKGHFTDKIETRVNFPMKELDLTNYMPLPLPPGQAPTQHLPYDDPRLQKPPYKYDLYAVTNHYGTLSSGHYTAFVASRGKMVVLR